MTTSSSINSHLLRQPFAFESAVTLWSGLTDVLPFAVPLESFPCGLPFLS